MSQRNCSKDGPTSSTNPEVTHDPCSYSGYTEPKEYHGGEKTTPTYLFCGLFGDPHLRTFKDHFQTCKVEVAGNGVGRNRKTQLIHIWLLDWCHQQNFKVSYRTGICWEYSTVERKQSRRFLDCVEDNFLTQLITIIFKSYQDCTDQKVYQAVTDDLPAAFVDGTTNGGDGDTRSLRIVEKVTGQYIEMHARYIGTTVYVRQLGHYLTLAIRMPRELVLAHEESQDLQLCVSGCPSSERIDESGRLALPALGQLFPQGGAAAPHSAYTLDTATTKCHEKMLVKDIYFYSCVFDLLTTGDANFTAAAHSALQDVEALHPRREHWHIFPRSQGGSVDKSSKFFVSFGLVCLNLLLLL
ncbi:repulsive guidance molecule B isoform 2-T2 [Porphyrio hochstetteri]